MDPMPSDPNSPESNSRWLLQELSRRLCQSLESMTGAEYRVETQTGAAPVGPVESVLWWEQALDLDPAACIWIGAPEDSWRALGKRVLEAAGIQAEGDGELKTTYLEILDQTLGAAAQNVAARVERKVERGRTRELTEAPETPHRALVTVSAGGAPVAMLELAFSAELLEGLRPQPAGDAENAVATLPAEPAELMSPVIGPENSRTLDLLLEVELPVSVSFGRTQLPLKDVLKLSTGSIVELNRSVSEPVEVIVNNCVIARGEVVVVEGNYGIRIQEIVSRQERLRSLN